MQRNVPAAARGAEIPVSRQKSGVSDWRRFCTSERNKSGKCGVCGVQILPAAKLFGLCDHRVQKFFVPVLGKGEQAPVNGQLPNWRQNLRFAAAWERSMEGMYPGFTRPVLFSYRFYNQDLTTGSLLIEIGGHGNNLNEALYAGQLAANGLVQALLGPDA